MSLIHEALERINGAPVPRPSRKKKRLKAPIIRLLRWYARLKNGRRKSALAGLVFMVCLIPAIVFSWFSFGGGSSGRDTKVAPYVLTGIVDGKEKQALINNKLVGVGDKIAGARVNEIKDKGVTLQIKRKKIYLSL